MVQNRLKELRKKSELTQEQLAQKLFVSRQTISNWENGRSLPDRENIKLLAETYNISTDILLQEESNRTIPPRDNSKERSRLIYVSILFLFIVAFSIPLSSIVIIQLLIFWKRYLNRHFYNYSLCILSIILSMNILAIFTVVYFF